MQYEVLTKETTQWFYVVEANSPEEAEEKLQKALDAGTAGQCELHSKGREEVVRGETSQVE
jgi:hypothetical protein